MQIMDAINRRIGKGALTIASAGVHDGWAMRREMRTTNYTSD